MESYIGPPNVSDRLVTVEEVERYHTTRNSDYGKEFTDEDWDRIASRLESLAELLTETYRVKQERGTRKS